MANQQNKDQSQQRTQGNQQNVSQGSQQQASQQAQGSQQQYWRSQFQSEPYYQQGRQFEDYQQAYQTGEQGRQQYGATGQSFSQAEQNLRGDYENATRSNSNALKWQDGASQACQAAWNRAGSQSQSKDRDMQSQKIHGESTGRTS